MAFFAIIEEITSGLGNNDFDEGKGTFGSYLWSLLWKHKTNNYVDLPNKD